MPENKVENEDQLNRERSLIVKQVNWFFRSAIALIALGAAAAFFGVYKYWLPESKINELGDYIGGTSGSLWSLAGLLLIYIAFLGQKQQILNQEREIGLNREELKLNREELRLTRDELRGQREQMVLQNEGIRLQNFETTFFKLIELHHQIISSSQATGVPFTGQLKNAIDDNFHGIYSELAKNDLAAERIDIIQAAFDDFHLNQSGRMFPFFSNLEVVFEFLADSPDEHRATYYAILRAQLTAIELKALFYLGLSRTGVKHVKPAIEEYGLLVNLPRHSVLRPGHLNLYRPTAYGLVDRHQS